MTKRIFRDGKLREGWVEFLRQFSFHHLAHLAFKFAKCSIDLAFLRLRHWANGLCRISQASGPIAHLLPEAERTIGKLRGPVRSSCPDDGLDLRFVAKKVAGPWQLMFYASGDWEWVMIWLFDGGLYRCDPGRHVAQWMRDELSDPS